MGKGNFSRFVILVVIIIGVCGYFVQPLAMSIRQGLDLQGGTHVVLQAVDTKDAKVDEDAMNRVQKIIELRVNGLGLTEPIIQREQGSHRIIVELPGVKDPEKAIEMLGKTGYLEFKDESGKSLLSGKDLKDSKAQMDGNNRAIVNLEFTPEGAKLFGDATAANVGKHIAILLDNQVLTNPVVESAIPDGKAIITGEKSLDEAQRLAVLLRSGALPVKVEILETRTIGPTLGADSKTKSEWAFFIGIVAIVLFMFIVYRMAGLVANVALLLYVVLLLGCLKLLGATLTLPGIAGLILSMGMAVDTNILIFERFKEEFRAGKTLRAAMDAGFSRAFATVIDAHATTFIAAAILYILGTSLVKGFALNLGLGIVLNLATALVGTQFMLKWLISGFSGKDGNKFGV